MKYSDFSNLLDTDLSWRKKEISDLYFLAQKDEQEVLMKSLILLIYAHWEGFIKKSSKLYLKYVSNKNLMLHELENNFHALSLKGEIKNLVNNKDNFSIDDPLQFIKAYKNPNRKFSISIDIENSRESSVINTEYNLKEKILKRIFSIVGLSYKPSLQTRGIYIDTRLLASRNTIAHGDVFQNTEGAEFSLSIKDVGKLKSVIFLIMDSFKEELSDYAFNEYYLINKSTEKNSYESRREEYLKKKFLDIEV